MLFPYALFIQILTRKVDLVHNQETNMLCLDKLKCFDCGSVIHVLVSSCFRFPMKQFPSVQLVGPTLMLLSARHVCFHDFADECLFFICGLCLRWEEGLISFFMVSLMFFLHFSITAGIVEIFFVTNVPVVELLLQLMTMLRMFEFVTDAWCVLIICLFDFLL